MSKCDFSLQFTGSSESLLQKAGSAISGAGGQFNGTDTGGNFELPTPLGAIKGSFEIQGSAIRVQVIQKPLLLGCGRIEEELRGYLAR